MPALPQNKELEEQLADDSLWNQTLHAGDKWYILDARWVSRLREKLKNSPEDVDFIQDFSNSTLVDANNVLLPSLQEEFDFTLVPEKCWKVITARFKGGPELVSEVKESNGIHVLELRPLKVTVRLASFPSISHQATLSKFMTVAEATKVIHALFSELASEPESSIRIVPAPEYGEEPCMDVAPHTLLGDAGFRLGGYVDVHTEANTNNNKIPSDSRTQSLLTSNVLPTGTRTTMTTIPSLPAPPASRNKIEGTGRKGEPGLCGLSQLGNTCFMNSSLQCLMHTSELSRYFLSGEYRSHINTKNPIGMQGQLAEVYSELLQGVWSGDHDSITPRAFKGKIEKYAPQFIGYQQHDSQELLGFLLDGLHEDLNQILEKPYVEIPDSKGLGDAELSAISWENHAKRNRSKIVDLFQGQLKSTLTCPECSHVSLTFDPFMYLSLPIPEAQTRSLKLLVISTDPARPSHFYRVEVPKLGKISTIATELAKQCPTVVPARTVIADSYHSQLFSVFDPQSVVSSIREYSTDLVAFGIGCDVEGAVRKVVKTRPITTSESSRFIAEARERLATRWAETRAKKSEFETVADKETDMHVDQPEEMTFTQGAESELSDTVNSESPEIGPMQPPQAMDTSDGATDTANDTATEDTNKEDLVTMRVIQLQVQKPSSSSYASSYSMPQSIGRCRLITVPEKATYAEFAALVADFVQEYCPTMDIEEELIKAAEPAKEAEASSSTIMETAVQWTSSILRRSGSKGSSLVAAHVNDRFQHEVKWGSERSAYYSSASSSPQTFTLNTEMKIQEEDTIALVFTNEGIGQFDEEAWKKEEGDTEEDEPKPREAVSLSKCLDLFDTVETLSEEDKWFCPKCHNDVCATKKMDLFRLPELLVVHLKRFNYSRYSRQKIETFIDFPTQGLDLSSHVRNLLPNDPAPVYDLYAVSNHYGGMGGGHYTAHALHDTKQEWYTFDDSRVTPIEVNRVVSSAGYVLFYRRRSDLSA